MSDTTQVLQAIVNGVGLGLIYGLVGMGLSVIYNASGILNFAQGIFVMLGGMLTHVLLTQAGVPFLLAALLAVGGAALSGVLMERLVIWPMWARRSPLYAIILATLAVQSIVQRVVVLMLGDKPRTYDGFTPGGPLKIGGIAIDYQIFWVLGGGALMVLLLWLFFNRTRPGRALRACSQNRDAAALLGIPVERMLSLSFALSAIVGAFAGILITPMQFVSYNSGDTLGIAGFIAAIIGGFSSPFGAVVGGIALGVVQSVVVVALGASYKNVIAFGIMLLVLLAFPQGILGRRKQ